MSPELASLFVCGSAMLGFRRLWRCSSCGKSTCTLRSWSSRALRLQRRSLGWKRRFTA